MAKKKRREISAFSLSFLDIMSCGFGAAVLLFLIIKHNIENVPPVPIPEPVVAIDLTSEVKLLEEEILEGEKNLVQIKNTISELNQQLVITQGLARQITEDIEDIGGEKEAVLADTDSSELETLKADLIKLEQQKKSLEDRVKETGESARQFAGEGDRAYVSGLKLGGSHLLILVDSSASMLDDTIVNVLRRRNMSDDRKRSAPKWQHAIKIVEWISAKLPIESQFQIYHFNTETEALLPNSKGRWLSVQDKASLDGAVKNLGQLSPAEGTNLEKAFTAANQLNPKPDNIYLITDGLPTQGSGFIIPRRNTISGQDRLRLLNRAVERLPRSPVNIILLPIEGDPQAPISYWRLSRATQGSFLSPSSDWP